MPFLSQKELDDIEASNASATEPTPGGTPTAPTGFLSPQELRDIESGAESLRQVTGDQIAGGESVAVPAEGSAARAGLTAARTPGRILDLLTSVGEGEPQRALLDFVARGASGVATGRAPDLPEGLSPVPSANQLAVESKLAEEVRGMSDLELLQAVRADPYKFGVPPSNLENFIGEDPRAAMQLLRQRILQPGPKPTVDEATIQVLRSMGYPAGQGEENTPEGRLTSAGLETAVYGGAGRVLRGAPLAALPKHPIVETAGVLGEVAGLEAADEAQAGPVGTLLSAAGGALAAQSVPAAFGAAKNARVFEALNAIRKNEAIPGAGEALAARMIQEGVDSQEALRRLDAAQELRESLTSPGFEPTLGAAVGDPATRTLESSVLANRPPGSPTTLRKVELRRAGGDQATVDELLLLRPHEDFGTTEDLVSSVEMAIQGRIDDAVAALDVQRGYVEGRLAAASPRSIVQASEAANKRISEMAATWEGQRRRAYRELGKKADSLNLRVPVNPIQSALKRTLDEFHGRNLLPSEIRSELAKILRPEKGKRSAAHTMQRLQGFQVDLNEALDAATGIATPRKRQAKQLAELNRGVEEAIDQLELLGRDPSTLSAREKRTLAELLQTNQLSPAERLAARDLGQEYKATKDSFKAGAVRFRDGTAGRINVTAGKRPLAVEQTLGEYFGPGAKGSTTMREFKRTVGEDGSAMNAMSDYVVALAVRQITDEAGNIIPGVSVSRKLERFKAANREAIAELPEPIQQRLRDVETLMREAESANIFKAALNPAELGLARLRGFVKNPERYIREIKTLKDPYLQQRAVEELLGAIPRTEVVDGVRRTSKELMALRRMLWRDLETDVIQEDSALRALPLGRDGLPQLRVDPTKLSARLRTNRDLYKRVFGPAHIAHLERILEVARVNSLIPAGGATRTLEEADTALKQVTRSGGLFNQILGPGKRSVLVLNAIDRVNRAMGAEEAQLLIAEAVMNEDVARRLLQTVPKGRERHAIQWLASNVQSLPLRARFQLALDEDDQAENSKKNDGSSSAAQTGVQGN